MNEQWNIVTVNNTANPFQRIVSRLNGACLRVENGQDATAATCDDTDPFQQWSVKSVGGFTGSIDGAVATVTIDNGAHDDAQCLTGSLKAVLERRDWHGFDSELELRAAAESMFPSATTDLTDNYRGA